MQIIYSYLIIEYCIAGNIYREKFFTNFATYSY